MTTKFNGNGVITGVADSFCLPCETYLNLEEIHAHVTNPSHQKTFQDTSYVEKFKGECIRKMRIGYYCEVCNIMLHTLAKTAIHVKDALHINNKNEKLIKKLDRGVVVFEDILIDINAWHGLSEGSCLLCENDYSNENDHKKDVMHILKLIQSKLELNVNKFVYRKIDEDSYNCLICNNIITKESKFTHCDSSDHKDNYFKCQQNKKDATNVQNDNDRTKNTKCDENMDIKHSKSTDVNMKPSKMKQIALINNKTSGQTQGDDVGIVQFSEDMAKAKAFAKEHKLKYSGNNAYCNVCNVTISSTIKRMEEHVAEPSHIEKTKNFKKSTSKLNMSKVPTYIVIEKAVEVQNFFCHDIVINDKYCINILSFFIISLKEGRARCNLCEINMNTGNVDHHRKSDKHVEKMRLTFVLTGFKTEFIREIRNNVFHCGFCNFVEGSIDQLKNHLNSVNHNELKSCSLLRLQRHLREIGEQDMREQLCINFLRHFN